MTLSTVLVILSLGALVISFLVDLAKSDSSDRRKWKNTLVLSATLLTVNGSVAIGRWIWDAKIREEAIKRSAEQQHTIRQFAQDVQSLEVLIEETLEQLQGAVDRLPQATASALRNDTGRIQARLNALSDRLSRHDQGEEAVDALRRAIEAVRGDISNLRTSIETHQTDILRTSPSTQPFRPLGVRSSTGQPQDASLAFTEIAKSDLHQDMSFRERTFTPPVILVGPSTAFNPVSVAPRHATSLRVSEPHEGDEVGAGVDVIGLGAAPAGEHIWVLVHRIGLQDIWWPQGKAEPSSESTEWSVLVTLGQARDVGAVFAIAVITVAEKEHSQLRQYLVKAMTTGDWRSIPMPPTTSAPIYRRVRKVSH